MLLCRLGHIFSQFMNPYVWSKELIFGLLLIFDVMIILMIFGHKLFPF